ncbi:hypothetical protein, partial [Leyella stercorea]|uniref:hypothetical protein n=1 Tax=Leyella stercorea TaxID=363265 RepID=UPI002FDF1DD7
CLHKKYRLLKTQQYYMSPDIFKTHTSLLVQFLLWQAAKPSGDNCTPWRQMHSMGYLPPLLISLRF